jgi:hypothetical protein
LLRGVAVTALMTACMLAAADSDAQTRRQQLAEQRRQIDAAYASRTAECRSRFVVTACLDIAQRERREALQRVKREEAALDDAERKQRTIERERRIAEKRRLAAERLVQEPVERVTRAAVAASAVAPAASAHEHAQAPHKPSAADEDERLRRAAATRLRQAEAEAHRRDVERRNAARAAEHARVAPLPIPGASASR